MNDTFFQDLSKTLDVILSTLPAVKREGLEGKELVAFLDCLDKFQFIINDVVDDMEDEPEGVTE